MSESVCSHDTQAKAAPTSCPTCRSSETADAPKAAAQMPINGLRVRIPAVFIYNPIPSEECN